jgi:hypothetical protein
MGLCKTLIQTIAGAMKKNKKGHRSQKSFLLQGNI